MDLKKKFRNKKKLGHKIAILTAYDYPMARILDECEMDIILVGDSLGMVVLGHDSTLPVTMEDMIHHTKAVARATKKSVVIADLPYQSYQTPKQAVENAKKLIRAGACGVKLEGGRKIEKQISALIKAKIPVMGHLGMTPQSVKEFGGYRVQGRDPQGAQKILEDSRLLDQLGVFSMVLECVPRALAKEITKAVKCPTIGIGAGKEVNGQVLVLNDMLGLESSVRPRFVRQYLGLEKSIKKAVLSYKHDVIKSRFPSLKESYS